MNRNKFGQFVGNTWKRFVRLVKLVVIWSVVACFIGGGIYVYTTYGPTMNLDTTSIVNKVTPKPEYTFEEFYKQKVVNENKRLESELNDAVKKATEELKSIYARKAELNVQNAIITKVEMVDGEQVKPVAIK